MYRDELCSRDARGGPATGTREAPPKRPARRNLSASLDPRAPEEGAVPLRRTPTCPSPACDPNMTFEVLDCEDQSPTNSTVVVGPASVSPCGGPGPGEPRPPPAAKGSGRSFQIPSLLDMRRAKPPYMAMTSAAQRKRKLNG
ncbi:hypothetical protein NHX12_005778 [Muraenolepis orangiensis]|uniref:Uncharacterized protein n=1 Tax=Muraenolepis orangiensis TaxID=630683 RepID=A0A9Q0ID83_9TELE|nr:hypothetical protein NHX12_005778 [Muraenolepis orangiensis]